MGRQACVEPLAAATASLFATARSRIGGARAGAHCQFSLHQLTALARSLSLAAPDVYTTEAHFTSLWQHEALRVLADRVPSVEARADLEACVRDALRQHLPVWGAGPRGRPGDPGAQLHVLDPAIGVLRPARADAEERRRHFEGAQRVGRARLGTTTRTRSGAARPARA